MSTAADLKVELTKLHQEGLALASTLSRRSKADAFPVGYQSWYSRALPVVKNLAPDRHAQFKSYYEVDPKRKWLSHDTYVIEDYLRGEEPYSHSHCDFDSRLEARRCLENQLAIFKSLEERIGWKLLDIEDQLLVAILEAELKSAKSLIKTSARAARTIAGLVMETYLKRLARRHRVRIVKQQPSLRDLNDAIKAAGIYDTVVWSQISWLADLKERDILQRHVSEQKAEARDLVEGAGWLIKNVF